MIFLRFVWEIVSPDELDTALRKYEKRHPGSKGTFFQFRRPGRFHYYTFTDQDVLQAIMHYLISSAIPYSEVNEAELPSYAREAIGAYRRALREIEE